MRAVLPSSISAVWTALAVLTGLPLAAAEEAPTYVDVTAETGLDFRHFSGASGEFHFPEISGAGGALLDYDGDGDLDLFLVQGSILDRKAAPADALAPPAEGALLADRLYRNDLADGRLRFTDVTRRAGLAEEAEHGQGVAVGDYDGDGHPDLYVVNAGPNRLWRNRGDGTFEDATAAAGAGDARWSAAATFFDADGDGDLDLFVGNYVDYVPARNIACTGEGGRRDYCGPSSYQPLPDRLLENAGDGTFRDVTAAGGLDAAFGAAFGVVSGDFDGDGHADLYVANDGTANQLWMGRGDGTFRDQALLRGVALNGAGQAEASMGIAAGDPDEDGDEDLFVTHLRHETHTLYLNDGAGMFSDRTAAAGLAGPSVPRTGFGVAWTDHDLDGDLDLVITHGAVTSLEEQRRDRAFPFAEPGQLFVQQTGDGGTPRFTEATPPALAAPLIGRGLLLGDLDNDGDQDVVITANSGPPRVLLNTTLSQGGVESGEAGAGRWVGLRLLLPTADGPPRDAVGATATVREAGAGADGAARVRRVRRDGSYASAQDPRIVLALLAARGKDGAAPDVEVGEAGVTTSDEAVADAAGVDAAGVDVEVRWPDGGRETWSGLAPGRYHPLLRGGGNPVPEPAVTGNPGPDRPTATSTDTDSPEPDGPAGEGEDRGDQNPGSQDPGDPNPSDSKRDEPGRGGKDPCNQNRDDPDRDRKHGGDPRVPDSSDETDSGDPGDRA